MTRSDEARLADLVEASRELTDVISVGHDAFVSSPLHVRAAERLLEIIGEASGSLSSTFREAHPAIPWQDVIALRILLAHRYHRVDIEQVWQIASVHVPALIAELT